MSWSDDFGSFLGSLLGGSGDPGYTDPNLPTGVATAVNGSGTIMSDGSTSPMSGSAGYTPSFSGVVQNIPKGPPKDPNAFDWGSVIGPSITAATGLAGIYGNQQNNAANLAANAQMEANRIQAEKDAAAALAAKQIKMQKIASLSSLYNNYANLTQKGGEDIQNGAIETGRNGAAPLIARAAALK